MTEQPFAGRHIGPSPGDAAAMLKAVGYSSVDELMDAAIPDEIRWHGTLDLPPAASGRRRPPSCARWPGATGRWCR